ncbi:unnamed protein product [Rotaria socialis]|uniref:Uncharacterized protein n=1 Tax=Rotaria socialis TaxID=392032 RepID=A0A821RUW2_9BILA|nr:unnamed protein product [Rotaria socialis]CAF4846862.1 unnamed protein product [Rotaria socialis]
MIYDNTKRAHERFQSLLMDLHFLKYCRSQDVIPKFLWFKTANKVLSLSSAYKECQRRLLNAEINSKYKYLNILKKNYYLFLDELKNSVPDTIFQHVLEYIIDRSRAVLYKRENKLREKMSRHEQLNRKFDPVDGNVVKNLSSRILSNEEVECLAHGLNYGLIPRKVDDINIISNIENFFHRVTDISQHHKKLFSELKEKNTIVDSDVRVITSKELTLANSLRSITDSFRSHAYHFGQIQNRINAEQQKYRNILGKLKQDKSIIVIRPDKGRGIVLLNKGEYLSKIHVILNDSSKFKCLSDDPTITRETKLTKLLNRLHDEGHISDQFWVMAKPTGSIPGRLYGLPKTHKKDVPLRPVLSAIGTFNYGLSKALLQILSNIIKKRI